MYVCMYVCIYKGNRVRDYHMQERARMIATEAGPSFPGKEELLAAAADARQP